MAIIGIDLGTTNSLACCWSGQGCRMIPNSFGEFLTPSVVGTDEEGNICIGKIARERRITDPSLTVAAFKRSMGMAKSFILGDKRLLPEELSSFILRQLKEDAEHYLNEPVSDAIISVPAYFNDDQRSATKAAGELAGLNVIRLVNEPSAAALADMITADEERTVMVFDFGGGTLDISIVDIYDRMIEILSIAGDNHLGGEDFDLLIVRQFLRENGLEEGALSGAEAAILKKQAELCKRCLTVRESSMLRCEIQGKPCSMLLSVEKLSELSAPLLLRFKEPMGRAMKDAGIVLTDLDGIIMVGGSSKMPVVREYVRKITQLELLCEIDPDQIVGMGTGILCGMVERKEEIKDLVLTDVCPFSLGVGVFSSEGEPDMSVIIERNTTLPCSRYKTYYTKYLGQSEIKFEIFQGENHKAKQNLKLGDLTAAVPVNYEDYEETEVRFTYDINGILEVLATSKATNEEASLVLVKDHVGLSAADVANRLKELSGLKRYPAEQSENRYLVAKGRSLYAESTGMLREKTEGVLGVFEEVLQRQNPREIKKCRNWVVRSFEFLESQIMKIGFRWADEIPEMEEDEWESNDEE